MDSSLPHGEDEQENNVNRKVWTLILQESGFGFFLNDMLKKM